MPSMNLDPCSFRPIRAIRDKAVQPRPPSAVLLLFPWLSAKSVVISSTSSQSRAGKRLTQSRPRQSRTAMPTSKRRHAAQRRQ